MHHRGNYISNKIVKFLLISEKSANVIVKEAEVSTELLTPLLTITPYLHFLFKLKGLCIF